MYLDSDAFCRTEAGPERRKCLRLTPQEGGDLITALHLCDSPCGTLDFCLPLIAERLSYTRGVPLIMLLTSEQTVLLA